MLMAYRLRIGKQLLMPNTISGVTSRFMMSSKTGIEAHPLGDRLKLSAAMAAYAGPMQDEAP